MAGNALVVETRTAVINAAAATAQTLPELAVQVTACQSMGALGTAGDTLTKVTVTSGTAGAADVQFTGTPTSPSDSLTLGTAAVAGQGLLVTYVPVGALVPSA